MVLTMITRNAGRRTAATRGGGISEQDGREGEKSRDQAGSGRNGQGSGQGSQGSGQGSQGGGQNGQESDQGSQGSSRGNRANGGGGGVPDFSTIITQQLHNLLHTIVAQVRNNQGNNKNQDDNITNDNNQGNVRTMNNERGGCSYKECMVCNPKEYDGKGGLIVYTCWIEKMESV
ncbi:hypothetical protein Tco_0577898 [Tanacetum coccineum]